MKKWVVWREITTVALAAAFSFGPTTSASAFELFGTCLIGSCEESADKDRDLIDPHRYTLNFETSDQTTEEVADTLKSASQLWQGRSAAVAGSAGLIARAKGDYRRILAGLYNEGFYAGSISITINGREAVDFKAGAELPFNSDVTIRVGTGPGYTFGKAEILNEAPPATDPKDVVDSPIEQGFVSGAPAKAGVVRLAGKLSVEAWRQQGFPLAKVEERNASAVHPDQQLNVSLRMQPGPKAAFGEVSVEGTHRMDPDFIAYMTGLKSGVEYDPDDLERAKKRLDRLGVFSTRKIEEASHLTAGGLLPLNVVVSERKRRRIGIGASLSSVDGASVESYWLHRNLFGKAEQIRFDAKVGGIGPTFDPDELDYLFATTFTKPGIFTPDTDFTGNLFAKREFNELYTETSAGGSALITNYYSDEITYTAGVFGNYGEFEDIFGTRRFLTTGLQGDIVYDGRDNKTEPTKGFYARLAAQPFYEWEFGNGAARVETEARAYLAVDEEKRTVLATRVKLGSLLGPPISQSPSNMLFTAGGGNSVRGYGYKSIGVDQPGGTISGGKSLFETSVELRQRINESFGAVAFADAGAVDSDSFIDFDDGLRVGVGLGLRYYTGLGPIRFDIAVPLNPETGDPDFAFYAGIGQAF